MNVVTVVGRVSDRPFRPGNGPRVVIKVTAQSRTGRSDQIEIDAFGEHGRYAQGLRMGDLVTVAGRLEERSYRADGEDVEELRCVADHIEVLQYASTQPATTSTPARR